MHDATDQFRAAMFRARLTPPHHIEADGELHRFSTNRTRIDNAGWYILHLDGIPAGAFGDWRTSLTCRWRAELNRPLSPGERAVHRKRMENIQQKQQAAAAERKIDSAERANAMWDKAIPAPNDHPYLVKKGVKSSGLRLLPGLSLVVPVMDGASLLSLQFISATGQKLFMRGGQVSGGYFLLGEPHGVVHIAEGYATAASIHEATGVAVAVAFNAGNLLPVARKLRARLLDTSFIICADDDVAIVGNPGLTKAREAAQAIGALLALPDFGPNRPEGATDFNDLHRHLGLDAVKAAIARATFPGGKAEEDAAPEPDRANGANGPIGNEEGSAWEAPDLSLLDGPAITAPPFPLSILGQYWQNWCTDAAKGANAPVDYTATALLAVAAALIGNARVVAASPTWQEPSILWAVLVGVPSAGKSPALDPLTRIIAAFEADMARDFEQTFQTYTAEAEMAALKKQGWKVSAVKELAAGRQPPSSPGDAIEATPPLRPRITIADATMEAAAEIAAANPKGLLLSRDELGGWWRGFNRYGGEGERQFWLQTYGARPYTVDRKKLGRPLVIPNLSASVLGGTQPDVLAQLLDTDQDGFAARLLYCFPEPVCGFTLTNQPLDVGGATMSLQRLHGLALADDGLGDPRPIVCSLTPDAAIIFEGWWGRGRAAATHHAGCFGAWLGKAGGLALRLALVLEYLRWCAQSAANSAISANGFPKEVGLDALQSAIQLVDEWAIPMARRAFGTAAISHDEADATALALWLKRNRCNQFNARDIRRSSGGPTGRLTKPHHMAAACKKLEEAGLIRFVGTRADSKPGRASLDYEVNPALLVS